MKKNLLESINNAINGGTAVYGFPSSASDPNLRDFTKEDALNHINSILSAISNSPVINPYSALNRIKNMLYIYGLGFDAVHHEFKESSGNFSIKLTQYNGPYGVTDQGTIRQDSGTKRNLDLSVRWSKTNGLYFVSAEIVPGKKEKASIIGENKKKDKVNVGSVSEEMNPIGEDFGAKNSFLGKLKGAVRDYNKRRKQRSAEIDKAYKDSMSPALRVHYGGSMVKECMDGNKKLLLGDKKVKTEDYNKTTSVLKHHDYEQKGKTTSNDGSPMDIWLHKQYMKPLVMVKKKEGNWYSGEMRSGKNANKLHKHLTSANEDFSLKPKSEDDKFKRQVQTPGYKRAAKFHTKGIENGPIKGKDLEHAKSSSKERYKRILDYGKGIKSKSTTNEDHSLKPKSKEDLAKRGVDTPGYKKAAAAVGSKTNIPHAHRQLRNLGMSSSGLRFHLDGMKSDYIKNVKKTKNIGPGMPDYYNEGSLLDKIKSIGKSKDDTSSRPNIMKYDRHNDFDPEEVPIFKSSLPEPKKTSTTEDFSLKPKSDADKAKREVNKADYDTYKHAVKMSHNAKTNDVPHRQTFFNRMKRDSMLDYKYLQVKSKTDKV